MPKHFEFVFAAYAIFFGILGAYLVFLIRRFQHNLRTLKSLPGKKDRSDQL